MKSYKRYIQVALPIAVALFIGGCSKSCSFLSGKKEPSPEEQNRPSYGGISVKRVVKRDIQMGEGNKQLQNGQTAIYKHTAWIYDPKKLANKVQIKAF